MRTLYFSSGPAVEAFRLHRWPGAGILFILLIQSKNK